MTVRLSPLSSEVVSGGAQAIDALAGEWRALCKGRFDQPFYQPEWIAAYVRAFAHEKKLLLVTARRNGRLVAVLPLVREVGMIDGLPARKLRAAANAHTCRYDLVHDEGAAAESVTAIWRALQDIPRWDVLELTDVPHGSGVGRLVRTAQADGCAVNVAPRARSPYLTLQHYSTPDMFCTSLDAKFRANLNRRMRKLQARGAVELVCTDIVDAQLGQFYALEARGWKGLERSAIACDPATLSFYDTIARRAGEGAQLSLYSLRCGGTPVAMHYGVAHRGRYYLLKTAYDESLRECSPGQLLTFEVLRDLVSRRFSEFDFLGPMMEWKRAWKPRLRPHADWHVFRGPAGHVLHAVRFRARPAVGRMLRDWKSPSGGPHD